MIGRAHLIAVVLLALLALAPSARADEPMFGVGVNRVFNDGFATDWDAQLGAVAGSGIRLARSDALWDQVEPQPPVAGVHTYQWGWPDMIATRLAAHGLDWLALLDYSAGWASSRPPDTHAAPRSADDYAAYAGAFARRYGRGGSFWTEHALVPYRPVTTYEIWNEEDSSRFWSNGPDPQAYAQLYLRARAAIKAADPAARVVVGGLVPSVTFVTDMYHSTPALAGSVDGVALHPYERDAIDVYRDVRFMRQTLDALGAGGVPLYVTELGWPTSGAGSSLVTAEAQRAVVLAQTTDALARSDCAIAAITPYTWTTPGRDPANVEDWYGIYGWNGGSTASADAYARVVAAWAANPAPGSGMPLCHGPDTDGDGYPDVIDGCPTDAAIHAGPCAADVAVSQAAGAMQTTPGRALAYGVSVVDFGTSAAESVTVSETLQAGGQVVSAGSDTGSCTVAATSVVCRLGTLARGQAAALRVVARAAAPGALVANAIVTSTTADPSPANNSVTTTTPIARPPFAGLRLAAASVPVSARHVARVKAACPRQTAGACIGALMLELPARGGPRRLGTGLFRLASGRRATLAVRLGGRALRLLRAGRRPRVIAGALTRDRYWTVVATTRRVRLAPG